MMTHTLNIARVQTICYVFYSDEYFHIEFTSYHKGHVTMLLKIYLAENNTHLVYINPGKSNMSIFKVELTNISTI